MLPLRGAGLGAPPGADMAIDPIQWPVILEVRQPEGTQREA